MDRCIEGWEAIGAGLGERVAGRREGKQGVLNPVRSETHLTRQRVIQMENLTETDVLIRLTENGFAVTMKPAGQPETYAEYETSAAGEPVGDLEVVRISRKAK